MSRKELYLSMFHCLANILCETEDVEGVEFLGDF